MAKPVTVEWTTTSEIIDNGSQYTQYRVSLTGDTTVDAMVPFGTLTHTFPSVDPGAYVAAVELVSDDAALVGPGMVSEAFDVIDDATLDVPSAVTVTVGATA
jgi:hypothetical protein